MKQPKDYKKFVTDMSDSVVAAKNSSAVYIGGTEVLSKIYTGQKIFVDTRDISESPHLIMDGMWEREISVIFENLIEPGDVVFDIGSTYGYYAMIAGSKLDQRQGARLFLIDANPIYKNYMIKNMTVNGLIELATISTVAVAGKAGELKLTLLKDDWASSTLQDQATFNSHRSAPYEIDKVINIKALTLDQYAKENQIESADMIKLDIEGLEEESYPGMGELIKSSPKLKMLFEFTTESYKQPKKLFSQIQKDFAYIWCMPEGGEPIAISSYQEMLDVADGKWIMLLISKIDLSDKL